MSFWEILRSANHNLLRNKARTLLTVIAIFVGSFTIILNSAISTGVNKFIDDQEASLGGEDYLMITTESAINSMASMMSGNNEPREYDPEQKIAAITHEQLEELKAIDGIDPDFYVAKMFSTEYITSKETEKKYMVTVGAMPPGDFRIAMAAGKLPEREVDAYEIALEPGYAEVLGLGSDEEAVGKTVQLAVKDMMTQKMKIFEATVTGVQAPGVVAVNGTIVSEKLEDAMYEVNAKYYPAGQESQVYQIQTRFDREKYTEDEIKAVLREHGFVGMTVSDMMGMIRSFFNVIIIVFDIFGGIALLAATIGIVNTLLMSVEERTREIGLDKALGMSSAKIFLSFSCEAILLGFWGSAVGVLVAILIGNVVNTVVHAPGGFLEVFPTFNLFDFSVSGIVAVMGVVMVISFIAGTAPAWKAAHKNPIEALRYE